MSDRILITGASSGLGRALALEHAAHGDRLVLVARRLDRLRQVALACKEAGAAEVLLLRGDVSQRRVLDQAVKQAQKAWNGLDWSYANAGYSQRGRLESMPLAAWRAQMAVNVEGVLHTVQASLPLLKRSPQGGRLILTGSVAGYASMAGAGGGYSASKAAVRIIAQLLDLELEGSGCSVTLASPGFFHSEIRRKDAQGRFDADKPEYMPGWLVGDEHELAHALRQAALKRRRELIWPLHAKLAVFLLRHFPGLAQSIARRVSRAREARRKELQG
jgi:NAD(P)-dependent dehydrogenase (short-subunit alcohol dehydrogenase family)